jgi:hypothetical protein
MGSSHTVDVINDIPKNTQNTIKTKIKRFPEVGSIFGLEGIGFPMGTVVNRSGLYL